MAAATTSPRQQLDGEQADRSARARSLARLLDTQFRIPGTDRRFGLDGLLGLVPGLGDAAGLVLSAVVIGQAVRLGARRGTVARMVLNVTTDALIGSIPLIGWIFDFAFKANVRNLDLLERHAVDPVGTDAHSRTVIRRTIVAVLVAVAVVVVAIFALFGWFLAALL